MHYPWNINGVKANVIDESLHKHWFLLAQKERRKIRNGGVCTQQIPFLKKIIEHSSYIRF